MKKGEFAWNKGKHLSEEHKRGISLAHIGKHHLEETKRKMSAAKKGISLSKEHIAKIAISSAGRQHTEETKRKMKENHSHLTGVDSPLYGRKYTEEHKQKIGNANKGKFVSEETKLKLSINHADFSGELNPNYGKPAPHNTGRGKCSICNKGHWVRSSWERMVADWLFGHGVEYLYEPLRFWFGRYSYLPDFYIPSLDLWIEVKGYIIPKNIIQHRMFVKLGYKLLIINDMRCFEETLMAYGAQK